MADNLSGVELRKEGVKFILKSLYKALSEATNVRAICRGEDDTYITAQMSSLRLADNGNIELCFQIEASTATRKISLIFVALNDSDGELVNLCREENIDLELPAGQSMVYRVQLDAEQFAANSDNAGGYDKIVLT